MDVERLVVRLTVDSSQYFAALSALESRLIAFSATAAAMTAATAIKSAAAYEQSNVAFTVMTGSAEKAKGLLTDITNLAIETPFKSGPLISAAQSLKSYGVATEDLIPTLRVLGDVASGGGANISLDEKLGRVVLAYGQVRTAGRLMGSELRQFTEAGIPVIENLAIVMNKPVSSIKGMVEEGQVGFRELSMAFNRMTGAGGLFFNMMQKQSETVAGRWSAFTENIQVGLRNLGLAFFKGFGLADLLKDMADFTKGMTTQSEMVENFFVRLREVFDIAMIGAKIFGDYLKSGLSEAIKQLTGTAPDWNDFRTAIIAATKAGVIGLGMLIEELKKVLVLMANLIEASGEAAAAMGFGEGGKSVYDRSRERGNNKLQSIGISAGRTAEWLTMRLFGGQEAADRYQKELEAAGLAQKAKNPLAGLAAGIRAMAAPGNGLQNMADMFDRQMAEANRRRDEGPTGQGFWNNFTKQMTDKLRASQVPIYPAVSGRALDMVKDLNKEFARGESPLRRFTMDLKAMNDILGYEKLSKGIQAIGVGTFGAIPFAPLTGILEQFNRQVEFQAGMMMDQMRKAVGTEMRFPAAVRRDTQEAQDIINFSTYGGRRQNVQEEMKTLLQQLVEQDTARRKYEAEALAALQAIQRDGLMVMPGEFK
jgi:tape measure domain-containing protein